MINLCTGCFAHNYDNQLCSEYADPTYSCPVGVLNQVAWGENGWELPVSRMFKDDVRKITTLVEAWQDDSH